MFIGIWVVVIGTVLLLVFVFHKSGTSGGGHPVGGTKIIGARR
jgi:hypothetical protein